MSDGIVPGSLSYQLVMDMGREEGAGDALSQAIIDLVRTRFPEFPELESLATEQVADARSATLHLLLVRIGQTSDAGEVHSLLLDLANKKLSEKDDDFLRESGIYQMILEEGREEARKEIRIQALRQTIVDVVEAHFPVLKVLAVQQVASVDNTAFMHQFIVKISRASDMKEAAGMLLDLPKEALPEQ